MYNHILVVFLSGWRSFTSMKYQAHGINKLLSSQYQVSSQKVMDCDKLMSGNKIKAMGTTQKVSTLRSDWS